MLRLQCPEIFCIVLEPEEQYVSLFNFLSGFKGRTNFMGLEDPLQPEPQNRTIKALVGIIRRVSWLVNNVKP